MSARAAQRLHRLSVGSPLVLRELIRVALANDSLRQHRDVWQLDGALPADAQLAELVSLRLSALDDGRREALELVALSEPLDFDTLLRLAGGPTVEWLEQQGLITIGPAQMSAGSAGAGRPQVRLAHPLYGEWLQSALPASRRRRLAGQLVASPPASDCSITAIMRPPIRCGSRCCACRPGWQRIRWRSWPRVAQRCVTMPRSRTRCCVLRWLLVAGCRPASRSLNRSHFRIRNRPAPCSPNWRQSRCPTSWRWASWRCRQWSRRCAATTRRQLLAPAGDVQFGTPADPVGRCVGAPARR